MNGAIFYLSNDIIVKTLLFFIIGSLVYMSGYRNYQYLRGLAKKEPFFGVAFIIMIFAIGIVKFQDVFLRSHASTKSSTLSVLLTMIGVLVYFTVNTGFFSVRLLLSLAFINLISPIGMHLVARAAYRNGAYMYRKDDGPRQSTILLSQKEFNSPEELKSRAKLREQCREKLYYKEHENNKLED